MTNDKVTRLVIVAESMEPVVHSILDHHDISVVRFWEGDPKVHSQVCSSLDKASEWLNSRNKGRSVGLTAVADWTTGSLGADMRDPSGDTTGVSSYVRDVTYANMFGTHVLWQQVRAEWIYGRER